jgi:hypothetical protein
MAKRGQRKQEGLLVSARVPPEIWTELEEKVAPILIEAERLSPGSGIKKSNPNALVNFSIKALVMGVRAIEAKAQAQAQAQS